MQATPPILMQVWFSGHGCKSHTSYVHVCVCNVCMCVCACACVCVCVCGWVGGWMGVCVCVCVGGEWNICGTSTFLLSHQLRTDQCSIHETDKTRSIDSKFFISGCCCFSPKLMSSVSASLALPGPYACCTVPLHHKCCST